MEKSVPFNADAEAYVLGCIFIDNSFIQNLIGKLNELDFKVIRHQQIFKAMVELSKNNITIDILSVCEKMQQNNVTVNDDFKFYISDLISSVPTTSNAQMYVQIVEEKSIERTLLEEMYGLQNQILSNKLDFNDVLDQVETKMIDIIRKRRTTKFLKLDEACEIVYNKIQKFVENKDELTGLNTGFPGLNSTTLGFQKGDLMILAARPALGKSTYAINLAMNISKLNNANVAFFSLEMSEEQIVMRMLSSIANVELSSIRSGNLAPDELILLGLAKEDLSKLNIYFDVNSSTNIADIRSKCRQLKNEDKLDFVIIDYLQLVTASSKGNRQEEVSTISRSLKVLARELEIPVLALSQLSRGIETRDDKEPVLADLRESGSIEQDADVVMFLFNRNDVEKKADIDLLQEKVEQASHEKKDRNDNKVKEIILKIAKNRQGSLNHFDYSFFGHFCRFVEQTTTKEIIKTKKERKKKLSK